MTTIKTYRYVVETGDLKYLSDLDRPGVLPGSPPPALISVPGNVVRMSDDGSRILFWTPAGELRLWRTGQGTLTLLTGLETGAAVSTLGARFSEDGKTVVFMSTRQGSGDVPTGAVHPSGNGPLQNQVYRFEEGVDDKPRCVSCPPVGAVSGPASFSLGLPYSTGFGNKHTSGGRMAGERAISSNGRRVYFSTTSRLDPRDQNNVIGVYEWSADREGSGLALLSSGAAGSEGAAMLDNDASGDNVFFVTRDSLTASDEDDLRDLYVARVGGGLDLPPLYSDDSSCAVGDCQQPSSRPGLPLVGSIGFVGGGNVSSSGAVRASVAVSKLKAIRGSAGRLRVRVPAAGRISVAGVSIRRANRSASRAGTYVVRVALNARARKSLRKKDRMRVGVRVSYRTGDGRLASQTVRVTFKQPQRSIKTKQGGR